MLLTAEIPLSASDTVPVLLALDPAVVAANDVSLLMRYRYQDITAVEGLVIPDDADVVVVRGLSGADIRDCETEAGYRYPSGERVRQASVRHAQRALDAWAAEQRELVEQMQRLNKRLEDAEGEARDELQASLAELVKQRDLRDATTVFETYREEYQDALAGAKLAALTRHEAWLQRRAEAICRRAVVTVWHKGVEAFAARHDGFPLDLFEASTDMSVATTKLELLQRWQAVDDDIQPLLNTPEDDRDEDHGVRLAHLVGQQASLSASLQLLEHVSGAACIVELARHIEEVSRLPKARLTCFASLSEWMAGATPDPGASGARPA